MNSVAARWNISSRDRAAEERLQRELGIPSLLAAILAQRGYTDPEEAELFLNPSLSHLHSPKLLPDYCEARDAILGAKERKELIYVHGDYDVDGVTSAALFNRFLSSINCQVKTHVPHRMKEGYGIHKSAVQAAAAAGAKLFVTCDCGVSAHEQVELAKEAGMQVVITDHHSIGDSLPGALAVVNPRRPDSEYPFADLCGAGVVFKLCQGISEEIGFKMEHYHRAFLDLAALGTIADVMPLIGENRIIARFGLKCLAETRKPGLRALMEAANISVEPGKSVRASQVGFQLGPRLNAAGRIDDAALALNLLLENDVQTATSIARRIEEVNSKRREEQLRVMDEAVELVLEQQLDKGSLIMVAKEGWHAGIVGIVAGRLVEMFCRPTFVLTIDATTGTAKGSARTIPGFNLAEAIRAFPDLMTGGGHALAAGCSMPAENVPLALKAMDAYAGERLKPEDFVPSIRVDMEVESAEVSMSAAEALSKLEPFGYGNPEPVFLARNIGVAQILPTKSPQHVRLTLQSQAGSTMSGIAFGIGERFTQAGSGIRADLLFQASVDEWKGSRNLKWQIKDFQPT